ncbi:hypothetical protein BA022_16500 [Diaphorobacter nitroreducens]|nr:hypothetical protein BA022_16500 [Diaphorobacter nitroreducens]
MNHVHEIAVCQLGKQEVHACQLLFVVQDLFASNLVLFPLGDTIIAGGIQNRSHPGQFVSQSLLDVRSQRQVKEFEMIAIDQINASLLAVATKAFRDKRCLGKVPGYIEV